MFAALGRTAALVGVGLAAGAVGTGVMTLAQTIEMKVTGREGSTVPADVVDEIAGVAPDQEEARNRFASMTHWGYGIGLGGIRGLLGATGIPARLADVLFFVAVWGAPMAYLPALGVAPPPTQWGAKQIGTDAGFHLVYAGAVAAAWHLLTRSRPVGGS